MTEHRRVCQLLSTTASRQRLTDHSRKRLLLQCNDSSAAWNQSTISWYMNSQLGSAPNPNCPKVPELFVLPRRHHARLGQALYRVPQLQPDRWQPGASLSLTSTLQLQIVPTPDFPFCCPSWALWLSSKRQTTTSPPSLPCFSRGSLLFGPCTPSTLPNNCCCIRGF